MSAKAQRVTESLLRRLRRQADEARITALRELSYCSGLPVAELRWIGRHATLRVFAAQTPIVTERMPSDFLYIVLQGTVTATGGGGDMTLDNTSIASAQTVTVSSFTLTDGNA